MATVARTKDIGEQEYWIQGFHLWKEGRAVMKSKHEAYKRFAVFEYDEGYSNWQFMSDGDTPENAMANYEEAWQPGEFILVQIIPVHISVAIQYKIDW